MGLETGKINESELCKAAKAGDSAAVEELVGRYAKLVRSCVRPYFIARAESEDLFQEGMLGLWKAVLSFDSTRGAPFAAYARLCIERQIISAVRAASAHKHEPLNSSLPLEKPLFTGDGTPQPQAPTLSDPEELVIGMEEQAERLRRLQALLSAFEKQVLSLYLGGFSYEEIAQKTNRPRKSVDNAIQRIRRKSVQIHIL